MKRFAAILCLTAMLSLMGSTAFSELVVVQAPGNGSGISRAPGIAPHGFYWNGTVADILEKQDDWSLVRIGSDALKVEGYMETKYLLPPSPIQNTSEIAVGLVPDGQSVPLLELPNAQAHVWGELTPGAKVAIIGRREGYYHVVLGNRHGFVAQDVIVRTQARVAPDMLAGIPEIGYVTLCEKPGETPALYQFPTEHAPEIKHPWLTSATPTVRYPIELIARVGDWFQVRIDNVHYHGFMRSSLFERVVMLDDWFHAETQIIAPGRYMVGRDVQPGLYTYTLEEGQSVRIDISGGGLYDKSIETTGPASYTLYLPPQATVVFAGEGRFQSASKDPVVFTGGRLSFAGNGMFLIASDLPAYSFTTTGMSITYAQADASKAGTVIRYNNFGEEISRISLDDGETHVDGDAAIQRGGFIEIENCTMTIAFSHNG